MKIKQLLYELLTLLAGFPPAGYRDDKSVKRRRGSMHLAPMVLLIGILAGCVSGGTKLTDQQINQFTVGQSSIQDVETALGKPTITQSFSDGSQSVIYEYDHAQPHAANFIPVVQIFASGKTVQFSKVNFIFGADGKLTKVARSEGEQDFKR